MNRKEQIYQLEKDWSENPRWENVERPYSAKDVVDLRGQVNVEYTLARRGAEKFWDLLQKDEPVSALGAVTGNQAIQQVCFYLLFFHYFLQQFVQINTLFREEY